MFYTWKEFSLWLNITLFEIWMFLWATLIFSILISLKIENIFNIINEKSFTWWYVFFPYFLYDVLASYFNIIIFIRQYQTGNIRAALLRLMFVIKRISVICLVKIFLIYKLENGLPATYSEIFVPIFFLLFFLVCRSFRI